MKIQITAYTIASDIIVGEVRDVTQEEHDSLVAFVKDFGIKGLKTFDIETDKGLVFLNTNHIVSILLRVLEN